ncbi:hypothetical protein [Archangium sp.]|jgi:hypothetical protein|uniref:hypothetical protein n=1 Tax=Archangium sp. TaxID=1872627 RepID=UPI003899B2DD
MRALLCLCLLVGLRAAAAEPPARVVPRVWAVPRVLEAIDVPGRTEALGMPVSMHAVRSGEKVEALELHFRRQFQEAGLFLPPPQDVVPLTREVQVTGLDPDTYIAYTVFLQPNPDGTTTVILTEAFLAERRRMEKEDAFAPVMPGAHGVLQTRTESTAVLQYSVKAGPEEAHRFHVQALAREGYREVEPGVFQHGADVLRVRARPLGDGELALVVVKLRDVTALSSTPPPGNAGASAGRAAP